MPTPPIPFLLPLARQNAYVGAMLPKQLELPPQATKAFVRDMKAFFKANTQLKQDEIAADAGRKLHSICRAAMKDIAP